MQYRKFCLLSFLLLIVGTASALAQEKPKRPVKNPPQYPNIIDLENKDSKPGAPKQTAPASDAQQPATVTVQPDALTKAFTIIAEELKSLSQEVKALNVRQQLEIEFLRMNRVEQRIATYENSLRPIRERIAALEAEDQTLQQLMTRESLLAQTANIGTFNRDATMAQIRYQHEARLNQVRAEVERLRGLEASQVQSLEIYQKLSDEIEKKIQQAEDKLRQFETSKAPATEQTAKPESNQPNSHQEK
ncbi:MAG: hypothetical protein SF097_19275 [Acidobacteriota bacterium]|nr:hypothetical protein [Acidobacteriota bacterium]